MNEALDEEPAASEDAELRDQREAGDDDGSQAMDTDERSRSLVARGSQQSS